MQLPELLEQIEAIRCGSDVRRYHTRRVHRQQTVGQHSHGVARLMFLLDPDCSREAIIAALDHDLAEYFTGDAPATAKWASPELKATLEGLEREYEARYGFISGSSLGAASAELLKFCDITELALFSLDEYNLGNRFAVEFLRNVEDIMWRYKEGHGHLRDNERVRMLAGYLSKQINQVEGKL